MAKLSTYNPNHRLTLSDQLFGIFGLGPFQNFRKKLDALGGVSLLSHGNYGLVGDGVASDSTNLQSLVNDAQGETVKLLPNKIYRLTSCLHIPHKMTLEAEVSTVIFIDAENVSNIRVTGDDVTIKNITIRGNSTGLGGLASDADGTGGHGIVGHGVERLQLINVHFEDIGVPVEESVHGNYASPVFGNGDDCYFGRNRFADSCHNRTGADLLFVGKDNVFDHNVSHSDCDACISSGGGGSAALIIGNWARRLPGTTARSGVLAEYGEYTTDARILANHMQGFAWHGYYATHTFSYPGLETYGGLTFSDNVAMYCGGGRTGDTSFNTGSFHLHGRRGLSGSGNKALFDGYDETMTPRAVLDTAGILFQDDVANVALSDTIIRQPYQTGVMFRSLNTGAMLENIQFSNLHVIDAVTSHGIHVNCQTTGAECIRNIKIHTGRVTTLSASANGLRGDNDNGAWFNNLTVDNIDFEYKGGSPTASAGVHWAGYSNYTRNRGRLAHSSVKGYSTGVNCSYTVNLFCPFALRLLNNRIEDASLGMGIGGGSVYWGIHEGTTGVNVTTMSPSRSRTGRILGPAGNDRVPVELTQVNLINAVPVDGAWVVGDRVLMLAKAGPIIGYECVTAGTIGTWRPIYNYGIGGNILAVKASPIIGSTAMSLDGMSAWSLTGTSSGPSYSNTNRYSRMARLEVAASAAADAVAGLRSPDFGWLLNTGFYVRLHMGLAAGQTVTTSRAFCGLAADGAAPTDVEPSSLIDIVGIGWDSADTNIQVMRNDGSGTATKVDLGASFPVPSADATSVYTVELISMGAGTGIQYSVTNEVTGVSVRGSFSTDLPNGGTSPLAPRLWSSVGGTSSVTGVAFGGFYGERPY